MSLQIEAAYISRLSWGQRLSPGCMSLLVSKWTVLRSWGRNLYIKARPNPFLSSSLFRRNMSLKHGEFVGSLDCGTTYGSALIHDLLSDIENYSSVRFIVFDRHADIVAQHQLEFPQYYPNPGSVTLWTPSNDCLLSYMQMAWPRRRWNTAACWSMYWSGYQIIGGIRVGQGKRQGHWCALYHMIVSVMI